MPFGGVVVVEAVCQGFGLNGGKDHMLAVGHDDGARPSAAGDIDHSATVPRVLNQTLDGRGIGRGNCHHALGGDQISEAYMDKVHGVFSLFDVLDLLADLLQLALHVHHQTGEGHVGNLGADGVDLAVHLL